MAKIILSQEVTGLGAAGDVVEVKMHVNRGVDIPADATPQELKLMGPGFWDPAEVVVSVR